MAKMLHRTVARTKQYRKEGMSQGDAMERAQSERETKDGGIRSETEEERKKRLAANEKFRQDTLLGGGA